MDALRFAVDSAVALDSDCEWAMAVGSIKSLNWIAAMALAAASELNPKSNKTIC